MTNFSSLAAAFLRYQESARRDIRTQFHSKPMTMNNRTLSGRNRKSRDTSSPSTSIEIRQRRPGIMMTSWLSSRCINHCLSAPTATRTDGRTDGQRE